ncbi:MAG: AbrB/MazE/SpoVT family DNA-binding domain-containing protein [archaeon]
MRKFFDASLSSKGQIVIAKELRDRLGLSQNQILRETVENGKLILVPVKRPSEMGGFLKGKMSKNAKQLIKETKSGWE